MTVIAVLTGSSSSESAIQLVSHGKLIGSTGVPGYLVPKNWFSHFYIYGVFAMLLVAENRGSLGWILLFAHLVRRVIEQVYLFPGDKDSKMHVGAYMLGFLFYTMVTLYVPDNPSSAFLWLLGNIIQHVSHAQLFRNRSSNASKSAPPQFLLFRYMNCPHYFGEMLIYVGLSSIESLDSIACALFVIVSLSINWRNHTRWYSKQVK